MFGLFRKKPELTAVLTNRQFLKLWGAQISTKTGENILNFAMVLLIYDATKSTLIVSLLVALLKIPPILIPSFAGVIADSYDRKRVLLFANIGRALLAVLALAFHTHAGALMVVAFSFSIIAQFFTPAESAALPALVPKENLFLANSFFSFTNYLSFLAGYAAAGPLLERLGVLRSFTIVIVLYGVSITLTSLLPSLTEHLKHFQHRTIHFFKDFQIVVERLKDGVRYVRENRATASLILQVTSVFAIEGAIISLIPSIAKTMLEFSLADISLFLIVPTGIGTVAGVLIANVLKRRVKRGRLIAVGLFLDGVGLILFGCWPLVKALVVNLGLPVDAVLHGYLMALALMSGFADPFVIVPIQTTLQEWTPEQERGRVFGLLTTTMNVIGLVPILLIGLLSTVVPIPGILLSLGVIILIVFGLSLRENRRAGLL